MNVAGGIWAPAAMRAVRIAASRAGKVIRTKIASAARPVQTALEPVLVHASPARQPVHPIAFLRQSRARLHHHAGSAARNFSTRPGPPPDKTKFLATKVGRAVSSFSGRAPFASTLRPNLTGGALPRSAGGYGLGSGRMGGARFFSHGPACQAQVIQNVSQAVRAFWISGQKAQFDGLNARGDARFRAVSAAQDSTLRKLSSSPRAPGTNLDFPLNPTVTALGPLAAAFPFPAADIVAAADPSIATEGFLDVLSADFARALKDLTATLADLRKLAALGDLPISLEKGGHILRVRFPGVDADTVESLCDDLGLTRGLVTQDPDFDAHVGGNIALKFPFASTVMDNDKQTVSKTLQGGRNKMDSSLRTLESFVDDRDGLYDSDIDDEMEVADMFYGDDGYSEIIQQNPWLASPASSSPAESLDEAELLEGYGTMSPASASQVAEYEGVEGVYRFLEECDRARGRF